MCKSNPQTNATVNYAIRISCPRKHYQDKENVTYQEHRFSQRPKIFYISCDFQDYTNTFWKDFRNSLILLVSLNFYFDYL